MDQVTDQHLQRVSGNPRLPKQPQSRNGNTAARTRPMRALKFKSLYGYQQSSGGRTEANEQRRAANQLQSTAKTSP